LSLPDRQFLRISVLDSYNIFSEADLFEAMTRLEKKTQSQMSTILITLQKATQKKKLQVIDLLEEKKAGNEI